MKNFLSKSIARTTGALVAAGSALALAKNAFAQVTVPPIDGLAQQTDFTELIISVISWALGIAGSVAVLYLIIGGFLYITSSGDESKLEKAKNTIKNAIIGIVVILLALVIVFTINTALTGSPTA